MKIEKLNLDEFVKASVSEDSQSTLVGGLNIRPYLNGDYDVAVSGNGPYTTYVDGMKESDNDTW